MRCQCGINGLRQRGGVQLVLYQFEPELLVEQQWTHLLGVPVEHVPVQLQLGDIARHCKHSGPGVHGVGRGRLELCGHPQSGKLAVSLVERVLGLHRMLALMYIL